MMTTELLDRWVAGGCQNPDCKNHTADDPLFVHARCHPRAGVDVSYQYGSGVLKVACRECHKNVMQVSVK